MQTLRNISLLEIKTPHGVCFGGSQEWYPEGWRRTSGCGPTAASNLIWYLAQSKPVLDGICNTGNGDMESFLRLMSEMFTFVTPSLWGVNTPAIFTDGILKYSTVHDTELVPHVLVIAKLFAARPALHEVRAFILSAFDADCPVAFLNLSNGSQQSLDSWHWVTITAIDPETMTVRISDTGNAMDIDLSAWLKTSLLGGALVYLTDPDRTPL